jgi:hypothetical protein
LVTKYSETTIYGKKPVKKVIVAAFDEIAALVKDETIRDVVKKLYKAEEVWDCQKDFRKAKTQLERDFYHQQIIGEYKWGFTKKKLKITDSLEEISAVYFLKRYYMYKQEMEYKAKQAEIKAKKQVIERDIECFKRKVKKLFP